MSNGITVKQRKLVRGVVETGNIAEAARRAGYSDRSNAHRALTTNDNVKSALELALEKEGIDDIAIAAAVGRLLRADNYKAVSAAIGHLIKLKGLEKPKKSLQVKVDYSDYAKTALNDDNTQSITPTQSQPTTTLEGRAVGVALVPSVSLVK